MKKLFRYLGMIVAILAGQLVATNFAYAEPLRDSQDLAGLFVINMRTFGDATEDVNKCTEARHFMGLRAWYDGIDAVCEGRQPEDEDELRKVIFMVIINVMIMLFQVIGYVAIGFVIWGGYLYMLARGDSGKVASGKKTIMNALIGLVLCLSASTISGAIIDISRGAAADANFFASIFNTAFVWAGIVCAIIIVIGGISYITSVGDPQKTAKAKNAIMYAIIGLAITLFAAAIVNVVVSAVSK